MRAAAADAAARFGARLAPIGATPVAEPDRTPSDNPRFHAIARHYGPIAHDPALCGCHVHVGVPGRAEAIEVCDRLRPWLPVVQALSANSPLCEGTDTGFASWRSVQLLRWPSLGPAPRHGSPEGYDRTVAAMVASGAMLDESMVLWYARPSARFPTVEVRVADVCPAVGDTVLLAGLIRALVDTVRAEIAAGRPATPVADELLRAAHWNAARTGMDGTLLDPVTGRAHPAWDMVETLLGFVAPALRRHGDQHVVDTELARVRREGTGAARQRRRLSSGGLPALLDEVAVRPQNSPPSALNSRSGVSPSR
jgi:carboxylate-amine ligase